MRRICPKVLPQTESRIRDLQAAKVLARNVRPARPVFAQLKEDRKEQLKQEDILVVEKEARAL